MAGPLSALSPNKQNARSSFSLAPSQSPGLSPRKSQDIEIYADENEENIQSPDRSPLPSAEICEHDESELQYLPSSPFQEAVTNEHTGHQYRDVTPRTATPNDKENEQLGTETPVQLESSSQQDDPQECDENPNPEQEDLMDLGGTLQEENQEDSISKPTTEYVDMEISQESDSNSVIHHDVQPAQPTQLRKVSNMTVNEVHDEHMSIIHGRANGGDHRMGEERAESRNEFTGDDTCLSTFSAVPNVDMTLFSKLAGDSPLKRMRQDSISPKKPPRKSHFLDLGSQAPGSARRSPRKYAFDEPYGNSAGSPMASPTHARKFPRIDENSNDLLDFTDQLSAYTRAARSSLADDLASINNSPARRARRASPAKIAGEGFRSPTKMSLLDFDLPPAPTPRSLPSITPRELESLKSSLLSQISSLKATLSGRDAEVSSLKEAVSDAERRVGEALEEVRNGEARRESLEAEQREWERRGAEMESVLREVKSDIVNGEQERERLGRKVEDAEKCREELEERVVELDNQLSAARQAANATPNPAIPSGSNLRTPEETASEVKDAVEKVARELHTLYKGKHETKVAALKKSYEARWEKRVREAENKLKESMEENERLKTERDATMSGVVPSAESAGTMTAGDATILRENEGLEADKRVQEAKIKGLEQEMITIKRDNETLRSELKTERAEKGELVAVVDEWLAMQQEQAQVQQQQHNEEREQEQELEQQQDQPPPPPPHMEFKRATPPAAPASTTSSSAGNDNSDDATTVTKPSVAAQPNGTSIPLNRAATSAQGGASGIKPRATGAPTPRIPRFGAPNHSRGNSGGEKSGIPTNLPRTPGIGRSGIMSSIERMGRGGNN